MLDLWYFVSVNILKMHSDAETFRGDTYHKLFLYDLYIIVFYDVQMLASIPKGDSHTSVPA